MAFKMKGFPYSGSALKTNHLDHLIDDPKESGIGTATKEIREVEENLSKSIKSYTSNADFESDQPEAYAKLKYLYETFVNEKGDPYNPTGK